MINKHIKLVKSQLKFFDYKISKSPKNTRIQATYWPLKYKFEQLLVYLQKQPAQKNISIKNNSDMQQANQINNRKGERKDTLEFEKKILEIMAQFPNGIHVKDIHKTIMNTMPNISLTKVANRISTMYSKKEILEWVSKGVYKIKEV